MKSLPRERERERESISNRGEALSRGLEMWKEWDSLVAQAVKNLPAMWEIRFNPSIGKIRWRREGLPAPVFLTGESHGQRSLAGYSPRSRKKSDTTERLTY